MAGDTSKNSKPPDWYAEGLGNIWLPYAQMKTAAAAAAGGPYTGLAHRAGRRPRADRRHRQLVDRLPRLQPAAYPACGGEAT